MRIRYFIPDWEDYLDADFDFEADRFSAPKKAERRDVYVHEFMGADTPYDGMLVSLAQLMGSKGVLRRANNGRAGEKSVRALLKLPRRLQLMGDCGAFSYVGQDEPPFTPEEAADLYADFGFDFGVSVDHIARPERSVVRDADPAKSEARERDRVELTITNAIRFIRAVRRRRYTYTPIAALQGIRPADFAQGLDACLAEGYTWFAIGGLVARTDSEIAEVLEAIDVVRRAVPYGKRRHLRFHLLGVFRPELLAVLRRTGVTSFDSATYLRKAWLRSDRNYLAPNGEWYAAIRVPPLSDARMRSSLRENGLSVETARRLEDRAMSALVGFGRRRMSRATALRRVTEYDALFPRLYEDGERIREAYGRTLEDRPWEQCACHICRDIGIHVMIFRGFNRNKRRGFHNTAMLYRWLKTANGPHWR